MSGMIVKGWLFEILHHSYGASWDWKIRKDIFTFLSLIIACSGAYGSTLGLWRGPDQAVYTAIKFPFLILATMCGSFVLNWMIAQLLGMKIHFVACMHILLRCYAIVSIILASFTPISLFILFNVHPVESAHGHVTHEVLLLLAVLFIAFAGVVSNLKLYESLLSFGGEEAVAKRVFWAWLGSHLLLGGQISWILRPFIGSPGYRVQFFRDNAFSGNFFEAIYFSAKTFF